jgi:hypothetical protein
MSIAAETVTLRNQPDKRAMWRPIASDAPPTRTRRALKCHRIVAASDRVVCQSVARSWITESPPGKRRRTFTTSVCGRDDCRRSEAACGDVEDRTPKRRNAETPKAAMLPIAAFEQFASAGAQ